MPDDTRKPPDPPKLKLVDKPDGGPSPGREVLSFRTLAEVLRHLTDQGYKLGKSKIYADSTWKNGKPPLIAPDPEGNFTSEVIKAYITAADLRKLDNTRASDPDLDKLDALSERKLIAEVEKLEAQRDNTRLEHEIKAGKYILRSEHEADLADRARLLKGQVLNFGKLRVDDIIELVGGEAQKAPDALALWEREVERFFGAYAKAGRIGMDVQP